MIIGTAGHIDHGKTSLVKALTGVDADRLPEEKARGITIDLGFAYIPAKDGQVIGFVDVPGHEKFVHTMAAGAAGMDHGLLVVAADDGLMPQTLEHLRILDLLAIPRLTVALSKIDAVEPARLQAVTQEITEYLKSTRFTEADIFPVSAKNLIGIDALKTHLFEQAEALKPRQGDYFRLAIDRVFVVKGVGVAITGAVTSGQVRVGDSLYLGPKQKPVKVRSIHAQNTPAESASVGMRCGLVLSGVEYSEVERGDWLTSTALNRLVQRFDCRIEVPHDAQRSIKDGQVLLLHHGTEFFTSRIILLDCAEVSAGQTAYAQCAFEKPVSVCWHDRIIMRDSSARYTLAGGLVLDTDPPLRGRKKPERIALLKALADSTVTQAWQILLERHEEALSLKNGSMLFNQRPEAAQATLQNYAPRELALGDDFYYCSDAIYQQYQDAVLSALARFHQEEPDEPGVAEERLRRMSLPGVKAGLFHVLLQRWIFDKQVSITGSFVHLPDHKVELTEKEKVLWERIYPRLIDGRYDPPWVRDLASQLSEPEANIRLLLRKVSRTSALVQLVPDLFYPIPTMQIMADMIRDIIEQDGYVTVISFKERVGLGRKRAIQILEAYDRLGFTRRLVSYRKGKKELEKDHRIIRNPELFSLEETVS